jgi:hypothetical protein
MNAVLPTLDEATHTYTLNGVRVPGVTSILAPICDFSRVPPDVLRAASEFGTAVHLACELDDRGDLDEEQLDPALAPYLLGWRKFSKDYTVKWSLIEELVYHPVMGYAGKLDRYGVVKGDDTVVDIKSSAQLYPSVGPQLAAYQKAIPGASLLTKRMAVQLKADGTYTAKSYTSPSDWPLFASLITLRNFCAQHGITPNFKELA